MEPAACSARALPSPRSGHLQLRVARTGQHSVRFKILLMDRRRDLPVQERPLELRRRFEQMVHDFAILRIFLLLAGIGLINHAVQADRRVFFTRLSQSPLFEHFRGSVSPLPARNRIEDHQPSSASGFAAESGRRRLRKTSRFCRSATAEKPLSGRGRAESSATVHGSGSGRPVCRGVLPRETSQTPASSSRRNSRSDPDRAASEHRTRVQTRCRDNAG